MKKTTGLLSIVLSGFVALSGAGCKNKAAPGPPQTLEQGVAQLRAALSAAGPDVQSNLYSGVIRGVRYGQFLEALAALDRIAGNPGLNDGQKKIVNDMAELLKQAVQKQQNAPTPAQ